MTERITTVLWRQETETIDPIVIVSAKKTQAVDTVDTLYERVVRAVTNWMKSTEEGRKAWKYASDDFNVGDLVSCLGDDDLVRFLANEGVKDFRIDDAEVSDKWSDYDTSLVDGNEVTETLGENEDCGYRSAGLPASDTDPTSTKPHRLRSARSRRETSDGMAVHFGKHSPRPD